MRHVIEDLSLFDKWLVKLQNFSHLLFKVLSIIVKKGLYAGLLTIRQKVALENRNWDNYNNLVIKHIDRYILNKGPLKKIMNQIEINSIRDFEYHDKVEQMESIKKNLLNLSIDELIIIYRYLKYFGSFVTSHFLRTVLLEKYSDNKMLKKINLSPLYIF